MRASVREDSTTRVITLEVSGVPDVDTTKSWQTKPRVFRPDHVTIRLVDGEVQEVKASGPFVLKSGGTSDKMREVQSWTRTPGSVRGNKLEQGPEWVQTLAREAPAGVTWWSTEPARPVSMSEHPSGALILDVD